MRTTVWLDDDVVAAIDKLRRERQIDFSEALNELVRAGLRSRPARRPFQQRTQDVGLRIDVSCVAEALEVLDAGEARGRPLSTGAAPSGDQPPRTTL